MSNNKGWIGVDLDGTLAHYDGWKGELHIGEPIMPMVKRVQDWLAEGRKVKIFTARVSEGSGDKARASVEEIRRHIALWCRINIGQALEVTNVKDFNMIALYDDRCREVETNTGKVVGEQQRPSVIVHGTQPFKVYLQQMRESHRDTFWVTLEPADGRKIENWILGAPSGFKKPYLTPSRHEDIEDAHDEARTWASLLNVTYDLANNKLLEPRA